MTPKRFGLAAAVLLAACSGPAKDKPSEEAKSSALVRTAPVESGSLPEVVTAYGAAEQTVKGERNVVAPLESTLTAVLVAIGDPVRAGQTVATLQPSPAVTLEFTKAVRDAQTAQAALARALRLRASGLVSDADVETARAAAAGAQASAESFRGRLVGVLRAPIDGVVQAVSMAPGGFAASGASILTLGSATGARVRLGLDPADAARVRAGDPVRLSSMTGDRSAESRVLSVDPRADPQTRQASVFAQLPAGGAFPSGAPIKGEITVTQRTGVPIAPKPAILYEGEKPYAFVVSGGTAHRRDLTLGVETADRVEVRQGVRAGERIAVEGAAALSDGLAVREEPRTR